MKISPTPTTLMTKICQIEVGGSSHLRRPLIQLSMTTYSVAVDDVTTNQMKSETNATELHICTSETASVIITVILYGEKSILEKI